MYGSRKEVLGVAKGATACIMLLRIAGEKNVDGFGSFKHRPPNRQV